MNQKLRLKDTVSSDVMPLFSEYGTKKVQDWVEALVDPGLKVPMVQPLFEQLKEKWMPL